MSVASGKKTSTTVGLDDLLNKGEETHLISAIQEERCKKVVEEEKRIAEVSKLSYQKVDYAAQLMKKPWIEPPLPDNEIVIEEATKKVKQRFSMLLIQRVVVLVLGLVMLPLIPSVYTLLIAVLFVLLMSFFIYLTIDARQKMLISAEERAKKQIETQIAAIKLYWQKLRVEHDNSESERVSSIKQILEGNVFALMRYINQMLVDMKLPVEIIADLRLYVDTPQIIFEIPSRSTIPMQRLVVTDDGRMTLESKDTVEINKQHFELCCACVMRLLTAVSSASPVFEKFYVNGLFDKRCYLSVAAERGSIEEACALPSGLAALSFLEGKFDIEEDSDLREIEPIEVEEWEGADDERIKVFQLKNSKK